MFRKNSISAGRITLLTGLLCSAAFIAFPARADQSMEELEARLEKAKKRNLQLKAEILERENIKIEAEALEKENARLEARTKSSNNPQASQAEGGIKAPDRPRAASSTGDTAKIQRHVASHSILERPNTSTDPKQKVNEALAAIPANDQRRQFTAADMRAPVYKEPPTIVNYWDGAYAGVNVGYASGGTNSARTYSTPVVDNFASLPTFPNQVYILTSTPNLFVSSLATSGVASIKQAGLSGGLQGGWNVRFSRSFVGGIEADIQGTTIQSDGSYAGYPVGQNSTYENYANSDPTGGTKGRVNQNILGGGDIKTGINWLGTVRARLGWLPLDTLMLYATGGLSYGSAYAETRNTFTTTALSVAEPRGTSTCCSFTIPNTSSSIGGYGRYNGTRTGWVAGGGLEWMFISNWSVKAEGLYYDLGKASFQSAAVGIPGNSVNVPTTQVRYDGAIGRLGLNYHFAQGAAPVSVRY